jgi:hypothetical protein
MGIHEEAGVGRLQPQPRPAVETDDLRAPVARVQEAGLSAGPLDR